MPGTVEITVRGLSYNLLGRLGTTVIFLAVSMLMVRVLAPQEYGTLHLAIAITGIIGLVGGLGLGTTLVRFIPEYRAKGAKDEEELILSAALKLRTSIAMVLCLILLAISGPVSRIYDSPNLDWVLQLYAIILFADLIGQTLNSVLKARFMQLKVNVRNVTLATVQLLGMLVIYRLGLGLREVVVLSIFVSGATLLVNLGLLRRDIRPSTIVRAALRKVERRFWRYGFYSSTLELSGYALSHASDTYFIGIFWGMGAVGLYSFGYRLAHMTVGFVPQILAGIGLASATVAFSKGGVNGLRRWHRQTTKLVLIICLPLALMLATLIKPIIELVFSPRYLGASFVATAFLFLFVVGAFSRVTFLALATLEEMRKLLFLRVIAVANVLLDLLLVPLLGMNGAVLATGSSIIVLACVQYLILRRIAQVSMPITPILKYLASAGGAAIPTFLMATKIQSIGFLWLLGAGFLFVLSYTTMVFLLRAWEPMDVEMLQGTRVPLKGHVVRIARWRDAW